MPDIVWTGVQQLIAALEKRVAIAPEVMAGAIYVEAERIMSDSRELVPVDDGTLRGSGIVQTPEMTGTGAEVEFGYGGAASEYALIQHERMDFAHRTGQAKYLEQPALEAESGLEGRLARSIGRRLETG